MSRSRSPIAVDFGARQVRALQLERQGARTVVRDAVAVALRTAPGHAAMPAELAAAARQALRCGSFRGREAVVALRLTDVATRHVRLPLERLDRPGAAIGELVQQHDAGTEELTICPLPIADLLDRGQQLREFLCCIAGERAIAGVLATTEAAGLVPTAIELAPLAQVRPLVHVAPSDSFAHVDIGADDTRITLVRAGHVVLLRRAPVGGSQLFAQLERRLELDGDSILALAAGPAATDRTLLDAVLGAIAEPIEQLLQRLADGIRYVGSLFHGRAVTSLRAAGAAAEIPGLVAHLGRRIGLSAERADAFAGLDTAAVVRRRGPLPAGFDTAIGLALGGLS